MEILLKPIIAEDKNYIWNVYEKAMKSHISNIWGWNLDWQKNDFETNLESHETYIIYMSEIRMGYVQALYDFEKTYINMLILEPMYQSKGFGLDVLKMIVKRQNNKPVQLRCFKVNQKAYKFYLSKGFEVIEVEDEFYYMSKQPTEPNQCVKFDSAEKMPLELRER